MKIYLLPKQAWALSIPLTGALIGMWLDRKETERMILFRDKSSLYGGNVKPGDPPTWP